MSWNRGKTVKKLGLIGGTGPESTLVYYREITRGVAKKNQGRFPNLTIESLSVFDVLDYCRAGDIAGLEAYLLKGMENLAGAGAQFAALTGITPHIALEGLRRRSPIPIVSMIDTACAYAREKGFGKLLLLGTLPTMEGTFFQKPFLENGISIVTPDASERRYIAEKIEAELEFGRVEPETREEMRRIALRIIEQERAEAVVLGCTELPPVFENMAFPAEKLDVMRIHIDALIDEILA